jgi:NADPH:quinone reductase-like Zn-dependent oxidoreductase
MKAIVMRAFGGPDVLHAEELPDPQPQTGEIVVAVHAASINGADSKVRRGIGTGHLLFPHVLGRDFSGVVRAVGPGVRGTAVGDPVFGVMDRGIEGTYADQLVINAALVARKPDRLTHIQAAALGLTGLTALWCIDAARLAAGDTILVHGGAGGVASLAIQLAHHRGARVMATASAASMDYVRSLGADQVIDYTTVDLTRVVAPCTVVLDTVGGAVHARSYDLLRSGGRLIWINAEPLPAGFQPPRQDVEAIRPAVTRDREHLERLLDLLARDALKPPLITTFPLSTAAKAHRAFEARHVRGKIVLTMA